MVQVESFRRRDGVTCALLRTEPEAAPKKRARAGKTAEKKASKPKAKK